MEPKIPKTMKAVVLHDWNDLRYEEVETPNCGPDEVLCRIKACGICGTDLHITKGDYKGLFPPKLPFIMGHEWFGEIVAVGSKVEGFEVGQRVVGEPQKGCGKCRRCMAGEYHLCMNTPYAEKGYKLIGHTVNGAYAEYQAFDPITLHLMPDSLGLEDGVSACNVGIGIEAIRRSKINIGDDVVLVGTGLLGLITLQLAKMGGAVRVIAVGRGYRLKMAGELGADELVDRTQCNVVERVKELTNGVGADVVIECAGTEQAFTDAFDCVRIGGRLTAMGLFSRKVPLNIDRLVLDEIDLVGSRGAPNCLPEAVRLLASGRIKVKPLVTHKLPLSDVKKGMDIFRNRLEDVIRVALVP